MSKDRLARLCINLLNLLRKGWGLAFAALAFLPGTVWLVLASSWMALALAMVPIDAWVVRPLCERCGFGPTTALLLSFGLAAFLEWTFWWGAELVAVLAAFSFALELRRLCAKLVRALVGAEEGEEVLAVAGPELEPEAA
jgi:hypothetical protein